MAQQTELIEREKKERSRKAKESAGSDAQAAAVAPPPASAQPAAPAAVEPPHPNQGAAKEASQPPTEAAIVRVEPQPRNAMERILQERVRIANFLELPTQMIALIEDRSHRGPPVVYVKKEGLLFMAIRRNGGKAPGYETKWHQMENDPKDPKYMAEVILKPSPDPTTWVNAFGSANRQTLKEHMLPFAMEMAETRATVRGLQKFTGCGFSVLLPEETVEQGGSLREVASDAQVVEADAPQAPQAGGLPKRDRGFYADEGDAAIPTGPPTVQPAAPPDAPVEAPEIDRKAVLNEVGRLLGRTGAKGSEVLDGYLKGHTVEGAAELPADALQALAAELRALAGK